MAGPSEISNLNEEMTEKYMNGGGPTDYTSTHGGLHTEEWTVAGGNEFVLHEEEASEMELFGSVPTCDTNLLAGLPTEAFRMDGANEDRCSQGVIFGEDVSTEDLADEWNFDGGTHTELWTVDEWTSDGWTHTDLWTVAGSTEPLDLNNGMTEMERQGNEIAAAVNWVEGLHTTTQRKRKASISMEDDAEDHQPPVKFRRVVWV